MNLKNVLRESKFPENKKISAQLQVGDRRKIAAYSGYTEGTIREMMGGYRRITDRAARAIIRLMDERKELNKSLEEIANTSI